jgi:hypothetical protein
MIDISPTYTRLNFAPTKTAIAINQFTTTVLLPNSVTLIFDDLNLPQFATDADAIEALAGRQAYQLIASREVKVTPAKTNMVLNLSKVLSWLRRVF